MTGSPACTRDAGITAPVPRRRRPAQKRSRGRRRRPLRVQPRDDPVRRQLRERPPGHRDGGRGPGRVGPATEDHVNPDHPDPRKASELAGVAAADRGAAVVVVRLPQVHDTVKQGLITYAVEIARQKGTSAYVGDGRNRYPAAHVSDVARLYRLAPEKGKPGDRFHAVAEEGVPVRDIAEVIGRGLNVPVVSLTPDQAPAHFGWFAAFAGLDLPASGAVTQRRLDWRPTGPGLMADLAAMRYA